VLPAGVNTTCKSDDTKVLESYLDKLPADSTANFGSDCLQVDGTIWIRGARGLTIEGGRWEQATPSPGETAVRNNPATAPYCGRSTYRNSLYSEPTAGTVIMFWIEGGCRITLSHMTIVGSNHGPGGGPLEQDTFVQFNGTQVALVDDVRMQAPYGDYVDASSLLECGNCGYDYPATDITVEGSTFSGSGREGIGLINVDRMRVDDNVFKSAADTMFDVEVDSLGGKQWDIDIANNTIVGQHYAYLLAADTGGIVERLQFSGNLMTNGGQMRVVFAIADAGSNIRIDHNTATGIDSASGFGDPAIKMTGNINGLTVAIDHNTVPINRHGLAEVPRGAIVCKQVCPPIHIVGPTQPALP
jgi:hypothetical protein